MQIQGEKVYDLWVKCDEQWCNPQSKKIFINDEEKLLKGYVPNINVYFIFNCKLLQKIERGQSNQTNKYLCPCSNQGQFKRNNGQSKQRPNSSQPFSNIKINNPSSNNFEQNILRHNLNSSQFSCQQNEQSRKNYFSNNNKPNIMRDNRTNITTFNLKSNQNKINMYLSNMY